MTAVIAAHRDVLVTAVFEAIVFAGFPVLGFAHGTYRPVRVMPETPSTLVSSGRGCQYP